jgi:hypothetical protein
MPDEPDPRWAAITLDMMERFGMMPEGGVTAENLPRVMILLGNWFARIAVSIGWAKPGEPYAALPFEACGYDRDVVLTSVLLHPDGDVVVTFHCGYDRDVVLASVLLHPDGDVVVTFPCGTRVFSPPIPRGSTVVLGDPPPFVG